MKIEIALAQIFSEVERAEKRKKRESFCRQA